MKVRQKLLLLLGAVLLVLALPLFAQDQLNLNDGGLNNILFGAGSRHISLTMEPQNCPGFPSGSICNFASSTANGTGRLNSNGTYVISTAATGCSTSPPVGCAGPFSLTVNADGSSTVQQTAPIQFIYTSPEGTLEGLLQFTSVTATNSQLDSTMVGTFTATGGSFASDFPSGGNVSLVLGLTFPLQTLWMIHGFDTVQIQSGTIVPATACTAQSSNSSNFNGTSIQAGDYIWFNANFAVQGQVSDGTTMSFTNATISFNANGNNYVLPAPNAMVTFSASAGCITTMFDSLTNTFVTTVPLGGSDEIFLDGLSYQVPAPGLPGGINPIVWEGEFSSSVPLQIAWKWGAAVYSQFSTNYSALGVKPSHTNACAYNNSDHAGTPEGVNSQNMPWKDFVIGGARGGGGSNFTGSWTGTVNVTTVCQ